MKDAFYCPQCKQPLTFNYDSDKVLDLNDKDFLGGYDATDKTTLAELKEMEMQPTHIFYCDECGIDITVSFGLPYQDKPPEGQPEQPPKPAQVQPDEDERYYWREYTTPCLISKLWDKLHLNYSTGLPMAEGILEDCRNIVGIIMERQHLPDPVICVHKYEWFEGCGAYVCTNCNDHKGLAKCYCGWGLAPGERLEDDVDND